jgi:hypothetical protein
VLGEGLEQDTVYTVYSEDIIIIQPTYVHMNTSRHTHILENKEHNNRNHNTLSRKCYLE